MIVSNGEKDSMRAYLSLALAHEEPGGGMFAVLKLIFAAKVDDKDEIFMNVNEAGQKEVQEVDLGVIAPGTSLQKPVYLRCPTQGQRILNISVHAIFTSINNICRCVSDPKQKMRWIF